MFVDEIVVSGKKFKLQHPGNREWIKLQSTLYDPVKGSIDMEKLLDYCFEHVVLPEEGRKLDLDSIPLSDLTEVWQVILPRFLTGKLESGYVYPEDRSSRKAGKKLLETKGKKE